MRQLALLAVLLFMLFNNVAAEEIDVYKNKEKATNEVDGQYIDKMKKGYAMYIDKKNSQIKDEDPKKDTKDLLSNILKVLKDSLVEQKKIRKILEKEYDPRPKIITNSKGEKCIENTSADCFAMPEHTKEAKMPIYKNFHNNPTLENAAKLIEWEDKLIYKYREVAHVRMQALEQFGDKIRPYNGINRPGYDNMSSQAKKIKKIAKQRKVEELLSNYELKFFFDNNHKHNIHAASGIYGFLKYIENTSSNISFIFNEESSKVIFKKAISELNIDMHIKNMKIEFNVVDKKMFKEVGVINSPALMLFDPMENTLQTLSTARASANKIFKRTYNFLMVHGKVKDSEFSDYKINHLNAEYLERNIKDKYNLTKDKWNKLNIKSVYEKEGKENGNY